MHTNNVNSTNVPSAVGQFGGANLMRGTILRKIVALCLEAGSGLRPSVLAPAIAVVSMQVLPSVAAAQIPLDREILIDIPANTPLEDALIQWGRASNITVMINTSTVDHQVAPKVRGKMTARAALGLLLNNSGLSFSNDGRRVQVIPSGSTFQSSWTEPDDDNAMLYASSDIEAHSSDSDSGQDNSKLSEVIVTAEKREERLIDVPITIDVVNSEELQQRAITNIDDLTLVVPGIFSTSTGWQRRVDLQGVVNTTGIWPTIGIYLDEADVTTSIPDVMSINTYDLERVEVLKGPQGTLYGEGSEGGTIRFITKSPDLTKLSLTTDVTALFTQDGAPGQRINAAVNTPVIADVLGFRIAGTFDHEGGWIDQPAANRENINSQNLTDVRVKGLWKPNSQLTITAMAEVHRNDMSTDEGEDPNGNYTQTFGLTTTPAVKDYFDIYNASITYDFSSFHLLNTTSYVNQDTRATDFGYLLVLGPPDQGAPYEVYQNPYEQLNKAFSDELRFSSVGGTPWQWSVGGSFRRISLAVNQAYLFAEEPAPLEPASLVGTAYFPNATDAVSRSSAAFGDTSYKITDRLTFGAGARYFHDDQSYSAASGYAPATFQTGTFHSIDPRAYIQLKLTADANIYASGSKGFRSGGFNSLDQPTYKPESIWTYQLGTKFATLSSRLRVDADIFYSDYTNFQNTAFSITNPVNDVLNVGIVHIKGTDLTIDYSPTKPWTFSLRADYIQAAFAGSEPGYSTGIIVGQGLGNPKYVFTLGVQRDFTIAGKMGFAHLDYNQQGPESITSPGNAWADQQTNIITMLNFNSGVYLSDSFRVSLFIQNLLNDRGQVGNVDLGNYGPRPRPRTLGIGFSSDFQ